jgi:hypothetical protein
MLFARLQGHQGITRRFSQKNTPEQERRISLPASFDSKFVAIVYLKAPHLPEFDQLMRQF